MSNLIHIDQIKGKEFFWYEDMASWQVVIGMRGFGEFRIDKWDMVRAEDSFRWRNGRAWTTEEAVNWAIDYERKQSEYIDFEECSPNILRLGIGNYGDEINQTK